MPVRAQLCQQMALFWDLDLEDEMVSEDCDEVLSLEISILLCVSCVCVRVHVCASESGHVYGCMWKPEVSLRNHQPCFSMGTGLHFQRPCPLSSWWGVRKHTDSLVLEKRTHLLIFPRLLINWGLRIQLCDLIGAIAFKPLSDLLLRPGAL